MYLGLHRSDYMLHTEEPLDSVRSDDGLPVMPKHALQVEFNTISSAFGAMASRVSSLHRYGAKYCEFCHFDHRGNFRL